MEQYTDNLEGYNADVFNNYGENEYEAENKSNFFDEYEKNFYKGKDEENDGEK